LIRRIFQAAALAALAAALSGCASTYLLDNRVQTFSSLPQLPANPSYRFDRLPSQQAFAAQSQLEAFADPALFRAGFRRDDAQPQYAVQITARVQPVLSPWADPWDGWGGWGFGYGHRGFGFGFGAPFPRMEQPWWQREVGIVVREIASNRVVYETRAANEGPLLDNGAVLPAMFDAALQGFPNPPQGVRRVDIQLGAR
jgi:hypothetical protein